MEITREFYDNIRNCLTTITIWCMFDIYIITKYFLYQRLAFDFKCTCVLPPRMHHNILITKTQNSLHFVYDINRCFVKRSLYV